MDSMARPPGTSRWLAPEGERREMTGNAGTQTSTPVDRITVALIPRAQEGLQHLMASTGYSKTDIVNRAITLYEFIDSQLDSGHELILMDPKTGTAEKIQLL